jgi:hypothetical protein
MKSILIILTLINLTDKIQHGFALQNASGSYKIEANGPQNDYRVESGTYIVHLETDADVYLYGAQVCEGDSVEIFEHIQIEIK